MNPANNHETDGGVRFCWAINQDGVMVHVGEVARGIACNCRCDECSRPLIARKGQKLADHFAHRIFSSCLPERAFHRAAKQILADAVNHDMEFRLPSGTDALLLCVALEHKLPAGPYIDALISTSAGDFAVEVEVPKVKTRAHTDAIRTLDLDVIQIELGPYSPKTDRQTLRDGLMRSAVRRWLHAPAVKCSVTKSSATTRQSAEAPHECVVSALAALRSRLENGALPCPPFSARAAKWTASLDMNETMRAAAKKTLHLYSIGESEAVVAGSGNMAIRAVGIVGDGRKTTEIDLVFCRGSNAGLRSQNDRPALIIPCDEDLPDDPPCPADGSWRFIEHWIDELDRRFAAGKGQG